MHAQDAHPPHALLHFDVDLHSPLQSTPPSLISRIGITLCPQETNPDMDVIATGTTTQLTLDPDTDSAHSFGTTGHYAGSLTLERMYYLHAAHCWSQRQHRAAPRPDAPPLPHEEPPPPDPAPLMPSYPDAIHALLLRKGCHRPGKQDSTKSLPSCSHLPSSLLKQLALAFNITHEWLTNPLTHCPHIQHYASADPDDSIFGALPDPYSHRWTGSGLFAPASTPTETYRALKWAVMSTSEPLPVLNIGILPQLGTTDGITKLLSLPTVHSLGTLYNVSTLAA